MGPYPFIFSNERRDRLKRHFVFWFCWWATQAFLYSFVKDAFNASYFFKLAVSAVDASGFMIPHIFLAYSLMYFVIPVFLLRGRYIASAAVALLLFIVTGVISALVSVYLIHNLRSLVLGPSYTNTPIPLETSLQMSLLGGLRAALSVAGVAAAIKLMKYWYVKQQRNLELQKENIASQLQLLKAQVHPHFLFNTLNNIYAHTQVSSPNAPMLVAGLSDLLRYMLYECDRQLVSFDKELKMVHDYVLLERVRYGNKLDVSIQLSGDTRGIYIAPLLLLPFIENCFKHGASQMLEQPWVSLQINIEDDWVKMKLLNGKTPGIPVASSGGIGITNVVKRLEYLYPGKHQLAINNEEDVFIVNLKLQLERRQAPEAGVMMSPNNMIHEFSQS